MQIYTPPAKIYIPEELTRLQPLGYTQTALFKYLVGLMPEKVEQIHRVMQDYRITPSHRFPGANVFWFIDAYNRCHYGQIKTFDAAGKTLKDAAGKQMVSSVVSVLDEIRYPWAKAYKAQEQKIDCFFGGHLYTHPEQIIGIVEGPATAVMMAVLYPSIIWMATGAAGYLKYYKLGPAIHAREIMLFPDYDLNNTAWVEWAEKHETKLIPWWLMEEEFTPRAGDDYKDMLHYLFTEKRELLINKYEYPNTWH